MKKGLLHYAFVILLLLLPTIVCAQSLTIKGRVTDANNGTPIVGCAVVDPINYTGATTDIDGYYTITIKSDCKTLQYNTLGYSIEDIEVGNKTTIDVQLKEESYEMDQVVVVGYGTQKKESVTGSISVATPEDIKKTSTSDLTGALQGQLPGLTIMQTSGQPGEESYSMRLRGVSTFNGDAQSPLILVDGIEQESMSMIDPNEVASISILKDASATAVFGVRGANGVILITTRTGDANEKPRLSVSAEFGLQRLANELEPVTSQQYALLTNEVASNYPDKLLPTYTDRQIELYGNGTNPLYPNTNWYDEIYKDFAMQSKVNANFSGASKRVKYFINAGYLNQDGMVDILPEEVLGYDARFMMNRINLRSNVDIDINDWITSSIKVATYFTSVNRPRGEKLDMFNDIGEYYKCLPTIPASVDPSFFEDGYVDSNLPRPVLLGMSTEGGNIANPVANNNYSGYSRDDKSQYNTALAFNFNLDRVLKGLSAKAQVSYDIYGSTTISSAFSGSKEQSPMDAYQFDVKEVDGVDVPYFNKLVDVNKAPEYGMSRSTSYSYKMNIQGMVNYNREFGVHNVGAMFVYQFDNKSATGSGTNLLPYNRIGYALRLTYGYDDRYMAEFNAGYNGSEQFAADKRFGFFPAASVGWYVSNEEFMKNQDVITNLKLRASYGVVGNDKIGKNRFLYIDKNSLSDKGIYSDLSSSNGDTYYIAMERIGNPNLTWETAYKQNYGFEMTLYKNLSVSFDYFKDYREGILITPEVPLALGIKDGVYPIANLGKMKNHGVELDVQYRGKITSDLSYRLRGSINFARNERIYTGETPKAEDYAYRYQEQGYSNGQIFGYHIDWNSPGNGYFTSQQEIDDYCAVYEFSEDPRPGDFVYIDTNGDGFINEKDIAPIGRPGSPELDYSFSLGLDYKGWDFSMLFYGIGNSHVNYAEYGIYEDADYVFQQHHLNAWTPERYESGELITYPALAYSGGSTSLGTNDFFVQNRRFLRLKNIELGYTLPKNWLMKTGFTNVRAYVNANNLFTWDNMIFDTVDPEQNNTRSVLPLTRVVNLGVNINF